MQHAVLQTFGSFNRKARIVVYCAQTDAPRPSPSSSSRQARYDFLKQELTKFSVSILVLVGVVLVGALGKQRRPPPAARRPPRHHQILAISAVAAAWAGLADCRAAVVKA